MISVGSLGRGRSERSVSEDGGEDSRGGGDSEGGGG